MRVLLDKGDKPQALVLMKIVKEEMRLYDEICEAHPSVKEMVENPPPIEE